MVNSVQDETFFTHGVTNFNPRLCFASVGLKRRLAKKPMRAFPSLERKKKGFAIVRDPHRATAYTPRSTLCLAHLLAQLVPESLRVLDIALERMDFLPALEDGHMKATEYNAGCHLLDGFVANHTTKLRTLPAPDSLTAFTGK